MAFDYKKEYKEFYMPPKEPGIVKVPAMKIYCSPWERRSVCPIL